MSIEAKILSIPGVRDIVAEFVFDPRDVFNWDIDPPSFTPSRPHLVPEHVCREILKLRTHCRLSQHCRAHVKYHWCNCGCITIAHSRTRFCRPWEPQKYVKYFSRLRDGKYVSNWCLIRERIPTLRKRLRDEY